MDRSNSLVFMILVAGASMLQAQEGRPYEALVEARIQKAIAATALVPDKTWKSNPGQGIYMALLYLHENRNLVEAEAIIKALCGNPLTTYAGKAVPQSRSEALFRIYLTKETRDRLSAEAKTTIEDFAWILITKHHRGITRAHADTPPWQVFDSENHHVNDRRRYLQALQVLRLAERYGPSRMFDGKKIDDHCKAWETFWIRYFEARVGKSTDLEIAHPSSYGICTVGVYYDLHDFAESPRLRELAGKFLTLYWAEVATEFDPRTGQRAVASTRNPYYDGQRQYWAAPLLFCYGWHDNDPQAGSLGMLPFLLSNYRPPAILAAIARDPNRSPALITSRRAATIVHADKKSETVGFDSNGNGHFRRDVYFTPDYTLATMTLDPSKAYYSGSRLAQVMGVTFAADPNSRIVVLGTGYYCDRAINGITGSGVSIIARDATATPGNDRFTSRGNRVFITNGPLWDNRVEDPSGWIFTRAGDAYAAVRVADGGYTVTTRTFEWPNRKIQETQETRGHCLELADMWAPVVLQMGRAGDYKSFEAFCDAVKDNRFAYGAGKLNYTSEAGETFEVWAKSKEIPKINGKRVNLNPAKAFDSPFLSMKHGSKTAVVSYPGFKDLVIQF